jgi:hypothetical protein
MSRGGLIIYLSCVKGDGFLRKRNLAVESNGPFHSPISELSDQKLRLSEITERIFLHGKSIGKLISTFY